VTVGASVVVVDKPPGLTSHDVVARIRRVAGTRRVGHAGTLDPMATGVLVVGVGRATRLLGHLSATEKSYEATIRLGASTTTDDADGAVVSRAFAGDLDEARVRSAVAAFLGEIDQVPSAVSAVKVGGQRSYARVRRGERVDLPPRRVHVFALEVSEVAAHHDHTDLAVRVVCSAGTYIRALARDLGAALGVGGHLTRLRRTAVGSFTLADARTLDQLAQRWEVMGMGAAAARAFPTVAVDESVAARVRHGAPLVSWTLPTTDRPVALLAPDGQLLALYRQRGCDAVAITVLAQQPG